MWCAHPPKGVSSSRAEQIKYKSRFSDERYTSASCIGNVTLFARKYTFRCLLFSSFTRCGRWYPVARQNCPTLSVINHLISAVLFLVFMKKCYNRPKFSPSKKKCRKEQKYSIVPMNFTFVSHNKCTNWRNVMFLWLWSVCLVK